MWFRRIFRPRDNRIDEGRAFPVHEPGSVVSLSPSALRQLDRLQLSASRYLPSQGVGSRPSLRRKPGSDFREHRKYVPGDDLRYVDWRASARQEHIFIRQEEQPRDITVYVLVDTSASMAWGTPPKSASALLLTAGIAYLALSHGDRLVVYPFSRGLRQPLGPITGKGQAPAVYRYLNNLAFTGETNFLEAVREFSRTVPTGGLVLVISDLLGTQDLSPALDAIPVPSWDVIFLHLLHTEELDPTISGNFEIVDVETLESVNYDINSSAVETYKQRLEAWRSGLELTCVENNAFYSLIPSHWSFATEVIPHLRSINILSTR